LTACSIALEPSRRLAAILAAIHAAALAAAIASVSGIPLVLIIVGVLVSGVCAVADALLRLPSSVQAFELEEDGSGRWRDRGGREHRVRCAQASWVSAGLVVLGLQTGRWRTRWVVLLPDSAAAESLRRLRVWLRWRPA
jgi:toxin CptA